jgi:hypothetical protein
VTDDSYRQGLAEIEALRARIAHIEDIARQPRPGLGDAIADHYSAPRPPKDRKTRDLENAAHGFVPDDQMEQAIRNRDRDPGAYAAAMAAMHADGMSLALYERGRRASLTLGTFTVPTPEGDAA